MASQISLDFNPPPSPVVPVVDHRVPREERPRLCWMSRAILERLRRGPATNRELAAMFPEGAAWRTRVADVRAFLRPAETIESEPLSGGLYRYRITSLEEETDAPRNSRTP